MIISKALAPAWCTQAALMAMCVSISLLTVVVPEAAAQSAESPSTPSAPGSTSAPESADSETPREAPQDSGGKIVFTSLRDGNAEIYVMNDDGSDQTRLTRDAAIDARPAFSPDGRKIAFMSDRDGNYQIYVMNVDGSEVSRLTSGPAANHHPEFSPDGRKITFTGASDCDRADIWVMNIDGSAQINLTHNEWSVPGVYSCLPTWSPDGRKIAFYSTEDGSQGVICVMDADGRNRTMLTHDVSVRGGEFGLITHVISPAWSRDGSRIVFVRVIIKWREWDVPWRFLEDRFITSMNADGSGEAPLTSIAEASCKPKFSPDGSKIVYVSGPRGHMDSEPFDYPFAETEIYIMNADGTGRIRLTNNSAKDDSPSWGPVVNTSTSTPDLASAPEPSRSTVTSH